MRDREHSIEPFPIWIARCSRREGPPWWPRKDAVESMLEREGFRPCSVVYARPSSGIRESMRGTPIPLKELRTFVAANLTGRHAFLNLLHFVETVEDTLRIAAFFGFDPEAVRSEIESADRPA